MGTVARGQDRIDFDRLFQPETRQALAAEDADFPERSSDARCLRRPAGGIIWCHRTPSGDTEFTVRGGPASFDLAETVARTCQTRMLYEDSDAFDRRMAAARAQGDTTTIRIQIT